MGLAAPFKRSYTDLFHKYVNNKQFVVEGNLAATLRQQTVHALLAAWKQVCKVQNITSAANKVGLLPFDPSKPLDSPYVRPTADDGRHEDIRRHRDVFSINNKEITLPDVIEEIRNKIRELSDKHLCLKLADFGGNLRRVAEYYIRRAAELNVFQLSVIPSILHLTEQPVHFWGIFPMGRDENQNQYS